MSTDGYAEDADLVACAGFSSKPSRSNRYLAPKVWTYFLILYNKELAQE